MISAPRVLNVSINDRPVGQLRELNDIWTFEYDVLWLEDANAFSLSNSLPMTTPLHIDGSSVRPVQWYFDNLLPEELLREVLAKEAKIAYFSDRGRLFQTDRGRRFSAIVDAQGCAQARS